MAGDPTLDGTGSGRCRLDRAERMSSSPVRSADLRRVSDLTRFRPEHVDLLFDRANDNAAPERQAEQPPSA